MASIGIAVNNTIHRVDVANQQSHYISVINSLTNNIIATIDVGYNEPSGMALSPDGSKLYVTEFNHSGDHLIVINTADNTLVNTIPIGLYSWGVVVSPDGKILYTVSRAENTVSVFSTQSLDLMATIPVGQNPINICTSNDGKLLYVTNFLSNNVSVIDTRIHTRNALKIG